jgi:undecaprenyl pyrophosphate phosphatase UppP
MRAFPGLGQVNFAVVSFYFVPAWGRDALRVLTSPYNGFEDRAHAVAAIYVRDLFDLGLTGLIRTSEIFAGAKMVVAAAFLAYLIEFARALVMRREPNRETVDVVLLLALATAVAWIVPILMRGDPDLIRLQATEFLLLVGAAVVITVERHLENSAHAGASAAVAQPAVAAPAAVAAQAAGPAQAALVALPPVQAALPR